MGFWSDLWNRDPSGITSNLNPESSVSPTWNPGDAQGVELVGFDATYSRSLPVVMPTPWDGWPADWGVPNWDLGSRFNELIDVAWMCLDINSRILSTMPVYRTTNGRISPPMSWMTNPDPAIYSSWSEFAKQLFWDYLFGESLSGRWPNFRMVTRPGSGCCHRGWSKSKCGKGPGCYKLPSGRDITSEVLHVRYKSTTDTAHGVGPARVGGWADAHRRDPQQVHSGSGRPRW